MMVSGCCRGLAPRRLPSAVLRTGRMVANWGVDLRVRPARPNDRQDFSPHGKVEPVGSFPSGSRGLAACDVGADGRAVVCSLYEVQSDAWLIEHFDPQAPARSQ